MQNHIWASERLHMAGEVIEQVFATAHHVIVSRTVDGVESGEVVYTAEDAMAKAEAETEAATHCLAARSAS